MEPAASPAEQPSEPGTALVPAAQLDPAPVQPAAVVPRWRAAGRPGRAAGWVRATLKRARPAGRRAARGLAAVWRQHPLEAACVTLMAIGGLTYPVPAWWVGVACWFAGAAVAAWSPLWDLWDKWGGLAGPVALVIIGTAAAVALGGTRPTADSYLHEAAMGSLYLIKAGTLVAAAYLAWRVHRGPRPPAVPSWRRDRRA